MPDIKIYYTSEVSFDGKYPRSILVFDYLKEPLILTEQGDTKYYVPDDLYYQNAGIRVLFVVKFDIFGKGRPISGLARVRQPTAIHLRFVARNRLVGTIHKQSFASLGASAVEEGCDVSCIPPAEQKSGVGRCVVCTDADGIFELCC